MAGRGLPNHRSFTEKVLHFSLERFSKPNFGSIRRFRTMTGLEMENWIEKRGRTVQKFRSTRPRTESNFRFGLTSCRSQNLPSEVRSLLCQVFDSFSLVTSSSSHASHLRGFTRSLTRPNWSFHSTRLMMSFFYTSAGDFGRYMVIISEWMGKRCWPWDHQWSTTGQKESPGLAQFDKEHFFGGDTRTAIFYSWTPEQQRWACNRMVDRISVCWT